VGPEQLLYGSDRPVLDPRRSALAAELDWERVSDGTGRALGAPVAVPA